MRREPGIWRTTRAGGSARSSVPQLEAVAAHAVEDGALVHDEIVGRGR